MANEDTIIGISQDRVFKMVMVLAPLILAMSGAGLAWGTFVLYVYFGMGASVAGTDIPLWVWASILFGALLSLACFIAILPFRRRRAWAYWFSVVVTVIVVLLAVLSWLVLLDGPRMLTSHHAEEWLLGIAVIVILLFLASIPVLLLRYRMRYFDAQVRS